MPANPPAPVFPAFWLGNTAAVTMDETVVFAGSVAPEAVEATVTVAPVKPAVVINPVTWPFVVFKYPVNMIVGKANVPDVPEKVSQVVPGGTLTELML